MSERKRLIAAYEATSYHCEIDAALVAIRVGQFSPQLDAALSAQSLCEWAWLTAFNPGSLLLSESDNRQRNTALRARISAKACPHWAAVAHADAGDWPLEEGFLIAGLSQSEALKLAKEFGQNAILFGESGNPAALVWVDDARINFL